MIQTDNTHHHIQYLRSRALVDALYIQLLWVVNINARMYLYKLTQTDTYIDKTFR